MSAAAASKVPAHVPQELVRAYLFSEQSGIERDPYEANRGVLDLPPIYYSTRQGLPRHGGVWVLNRANIIRDCYHDAGLFSSRNATGFLRLVGRDYDMIPVELDPPEHTKFRRILAPWFQPSQIKKMEGAIRQRARDLLDKALGGTGVEFEVAFGRPFPVSIFLDLMGLPQDRLFEFVEWEELLLHGSSIEEVTQGASFILGYLEGVLAEFKARPLEQSLISHIVHAEIDGRPLTDDEIMGISFLLFFGGLDTVAATLNFIFKHLAEHPEDQRLLRDEPELIPGAVEEFLRAFSVVPSPRIVTRDVTFHGVEMKAGDRVLLNVMMSGRDGLSDLHRVDLRRKNVRHLAFAEGPHNCLGSHLARRELRVALQEWIERAPMFTTDPTDPPVTHAQGVWGVKRLPLLWTADA